eukprot:COSAG02_NODE_326_length_24603_cov_123.455681_12_plen_54_part_00
MATLVFVLLVPDSLVIIMLCAFKRREIISDWTSERSGEDDGDDDSAGAPEPVP